MAIEDHLNKALAADSPTLLEEAIDVLLTELRSSESDRAQELAILLLSTLGAPETIEKLQSDPETHIVLCRALATSHYFLDQLPEAITWAQRALERPVSADWEHKRIWTRIELARCLKRYELHLEAESVLEKGLGQLPDHLSECPADVEELWRKLQLEAAITAHELTDFRRAAVLYEQLCDRPPSSDTDWRCKIGLGITLAELGNYDPAIRHLEDVRANAPDELKDEALPSLQSTLYVRAVERPPHELSVAIDDCRRLLAGGLVEPEMEYRVKWALGAALASFGHTDYDEIVALVFPAANSLASLDGRTRATRDLHAFRYRKAFEDCKNGRHAEAIAELGTLLQGEIGDKSLEISALLALAYCRYHLKDYAAAERQLQTVLGLTRMPDELRDSAQKLKSILEAVRRSGANDN